MAKKKFFGFPLNHEAASRKSLLCKAVSESLISGKPLEWAKKKNLISMKEELVKDFTSMKDELAKDFTFKREELIIAKSLNYKKAISVKDGREVFVAVDSKKKRPPKFYFYQIEQELEKIKLPELQEAKLTFMHVDDLQLGRKIKAVKYVRGVNKIRGVHEVRGVVETLVGDGDSFEDEPFADVPCGLGSFGDGIHGGLRHGGGIQAIGYSPVCCCSVVNGRIVKGARRFLETSTDVVRYIDDTSDDMDVDEVKDDFSELKLKSSDKADLYMELADRFYMYFKSAAYPEIHYTKTCIRIDGEDPEDSYIFQFNMLDPGAYLVSLYVLHLALKDKWDEGDDVKAQRLRERIEEVYPEHSCYLVRITHDIEEMSSERFMEKYKNTMMGNDIKRPDEGFLVRTDLSYFLVAKWHADRDMQYNLLYSVAHEIIDRIYNTDRLDKKSKWNWALVRRAMLKNGLLTDNDISEYKFAQCIYTCLPKKFIDDYMKKAKDKDAAKQNLILAIRQQVSTHDKDMKKGEAEKAIAYKKIQEIVELFNSRGLYRLAA